MISLSHLALAGALAACAAGIGGYFHGVGVGVDQERSAQMRALAEADKVRKQLQAQIDASAEQFQSNEYARVANVREIYHESQKIIERPVYRNVCIDAAGVGLLDRAAATANGENLAPASGDAASVAARPED